MAITIAKKGPEASEQQYSTLLLGAIVFVLGLFITYLVQQSLKVKEHEQFEHQFQTKFVEATNEVAETLHVYEQALRAAQGHFVGSDHVSREDFSRFHASLDLEKHYPGIQGLGYTVVVRPRDKAVFEAGIRAGGYPDFAISPAGEREVYTAIVYLEPFEGRNLRAFGFDMYSEAKRRRAMDRAIDTGEASITEKVVLVQDSSEERTYSMLMYLPLYRNTSGRQISEDMTLTERRARHYGWVYAVFRIHDLMTHIGKKHEADIQLQIFDGDASLSANLVFGDAHASGTYQAGKALQIAGREWQVVGYSTAKFESEALATLSNLAVKVGISLTVLLTILVALLASGRKHALSIAKRMTSALRESEERLTLAKNAALVGIWDLRNDAVIWDVNMYALFREPMIGDRITLASWMKLIHPEDRPGFEAALKATIEHNSRFDVAFRMERPASPTLYLHAKASPVRDSAGGVTRLVGTCIDITEDRNRENQLRETEARWKYALEGVGDGVWDWNIPQGTVIFSERLVTMLGFQPEEFQPKLEEWVERIHPDDKAQVMEDVAAFLDGSQPQYRNEHRLQCKDGSWLWILDRGRVISRDVDGKPLRAIGTHTDISQQKKTELDLRLSEERFRQSFDYAAVGKALVSIEGRFMQVNDALCKLLGYSAEELVQKTFQEITYPEDLEVDLKYMRDLIDGKRQYYRMEKRYIHKDGHLIWILLNGSRVAGPDGKVVYFIAQIQDISEQRALIQELALQARNDSLTGLNNRRYFLERCEEELNRTVRSEKAMSLLMLDIDHFKRVNDTYGHKTGDQVLIRLAEIMRHTLRAIDIIGRYGGEEFVVLLPETDAQAAMEIAERLRLNIAEADFVPEAGMPLKVTVSIGVSSLDAGQTNIDIMINAADGALYRAKNTGRNMVMLANKPS
jgi:diguanylate cyclase (GGDEF)-like protein/PAS domain S-box-containing protein